MSSDVDASAAHEKAIPKVAHPRKQRGRLTIFLGAAHGVGKTFAMLQTAIVKQRDEDGIIVGTISSHGLSENDHLIAKLHSIPARIVEHGGRLYEELDLDAIIECKPALVLADELAYTNAPVGNRATKRHEDVEELLKAGIDVYTTLNVEEIESLNALVEEIIGFRVRETVPDEVVDNADDLVAIDCAPERLVQRWREGKVHLPLGASGNAERYFAPSSLAALRDLALRRTARRVDDQMLALMREYAVSTLYPASERILVCINEAPTNQSLIHYTSRLAIRLQARWTALYVESHEYARLSEGERDRIADRLRLAERLGGSAMMISGGSVTRQILTYARENNVKTIVLGRSRRAFLSKLVRRPLARRLVQNAGDIAVHVIPCDDVRAEERALPADDVRAEATGFLGTARRWRQSVGSLALTLAALAILTGFGISIASVVSRTVISLMYLTFVLLTAVGFGLLSSIVASIGSIIAYDYFFVPPLYSLDVESREDVITLSFFLIVALITSSITSRTRSQAQIARNRVQTAAELYSFSRYLAEVTELDELLEAAARRIAETLDVSVVLLVPDNGNLVPRFRHPSDIGIDDEELRKAALQLHDRRPLEEICRSFDGRRWLYFPLRTARRVEGVVGIVHLRGWPVPNADDRRLLLSLVDQTNIALARIVLVAEANETRILRETERLRSSLLSSIAHDFRTPLASVLGALTALRSRDASFDHNTRDELLAVAQEEAERLSRFVSNLLDMTRLESGAILIKLELCDVSEIIASAVRRARGFFTKHRLTTAIASDIPMLPLDYVLLDQALFNLLDNAAKYSSPGSLISVTARRSGAAVIVEIADEGVGIPENDLERIFEKSYRARSGDSGRPGTGLGLTICHWFIEAQGGTISAANRTDRSGAIFTIVFPTKGTEVTSKI